MSQRIIYNTVDDLGGKHAVLYPSGIGEIEYVDIFGASSRYAIELDTHVIFENALAIPVAAALKTPTKVCLVIDDKECYIPDGLLEEMIDAALNNAVGKEVVKVTGELSKRLIAAVTEFLVAEDMVYEWAKDNLLAIPFATNEMGSFNMYALFRISGDIEQVIFYARLRGDIPESGREAVMEYITRANYAMALGNFEMDLRDGEVRFKTCVDVSGEVDINRKTLSMHFHTARLMLVKYHPGFVRVCDGEQPKLVIKEIES